MNRQPSRVNGVLLLFFVSWVAARAIGADTLPISIQSDGGTWAVNVDSKPFVVVDPIHFAKPIIYPVYGPGQVPMTRNFPMRQDVPGEPKDHPHHKSIWFAHGDVNGVSYWDERGTIRNRHAEQISATTLRLDDDLVDPQAPEGEPICRETLTLSFGAHESSRWIDWDIEIKATTRDVILGDTKEGTLGLRVHPNLQLENTPANVVTTANGRAINSEGIQGVDVWGKRARWVDYSGTIDAQPVGITFMDHPTNLRHPTYWHARSYGLFAANPFGLSSFVGPEAKGAHTIPQGQSLRMRYRMAFHRDAATPASAEAAYQQFLSDIQ